MNHSALLFLILFFANGTDSIATKLISNDVANLVGNYLDQYDVSKMKATSKNWKKIEVYENLFPNEGCVQLFRHLATDKFRFTDPNKLIWYKKELMEILRRAEGAKWKGVCRWLHEHIFPGRMMLTNYILRNWTEGSSQFSERMMSVAAQNVDVTFSIHAVTLLMIAADYSANAVAKLLERDADIDVNAIDNNGRTALHHAANASYEENYIACEVLLKFRADVHARDYFGATALHRAGSGSGRKVAEILLANGADFNAQCDDGSTALMIMVRGSNHIDAEEVVELLLDSGANISMKNKNGETVFSIMEDIEQSNREFVDDDSDLDDDREFLDDEEFEHPLRDIIEKYL